MAQATDWHDHHDVVAILKYVKIYRSHYKIGPEVIQQGGDDWSETQQYVWGTLVHTREFEGDWVMLSEEGWRKHIAQFIRLNAAVCLFPRVV